MFNCQQIKLNATRFVLQKTMSFKKWRFFVSQKSIIWRFNTSSCEEILHQTKLFFSGNQDHPEYLWTSFCGDLNVLMNYLVWMPLMCYICNWCCTIVIEYHQIFIMLLLGNEIWLINFNNSFSMIFWYFCISTHY